MTFTVLWKSEALDQLTEIWVRARNRSAISGAADQIDQWLRHDPESKGESRTGNERLGIIPPLAIVIEVKETDRMVEILSVVDSTHEPN